jgi:hypothetical protein
MPKMMLSFLLVAASFLSQQTTAFAPPTAPVARQSTELAADNRRAFLASIATATVAATTAFSPATAFAAQQDKVLVLGGTGLVGSRVVTKLQSMGIDVIATSRDGRDGTRKLDFASSSNVASDIAELAKGCTAVISTVGVIGTDQDATVNAASGLAAGGAKEAGVQRFVYISVAPEVRELAKGVSFLQNYMTGKSFAEESIQTYFPSSFTLIEPTFIYGGNKFGVSPPRVASGYGKLIEGLLSSAPLRAVTSVAPAGIIKIGLEPPVAAETVANAAIAGALGKATLSTLDTYDKIQEAAKSL